MRARQHAYWTHAPVGKCRLRFYSSGKSTTVERTIQYWFVEFVSISSSFLHNCCLACKKRGVIKTYAGTFYTRFRSAGNTTTSLVGKAIAVPATAARVAYNSACTLGNGVKNGVYGIGNAVRNQLGRFAAWRNKPKPGV